MLKRKHRMIAFLTILSIFITYSSTVAFATEGEVIPEKKEMVISNVTIHKPEEIAEEVEEETTPPESFEYQFDGTEDMSAWGGYNGWRVRNGYYGVISRSNAYHGDNRTMTNMGDDFILEYDLQFTQQEGNTIGLSIAMGERGLLIRMRPRDFFIHTASGTVYSDELDISNPTKWYRIKVETYNYMERSKIYVDGKCVADVENFPAASGGEKIIHVYANGLDNGYNELRIDWMKFTPIVYSRATTVHVDKATIEEGQAVEVHTSLQDGIEVPSMNYRINGKTVATGFPPEYRTNIENLPIGIHEITAEYGDHTGKAATVQVTPMVLADFSVVENSNGGLNLSLKNYANIPGNEAKVEYHLDGVPVATATKEPFAVTVEDVTPEAHILSAVLRNSGGMTVKEMTKKWIPGFENGEISQNYSNEIFYTVSGTKGKAEIEMGNGTHLLTLRHTPQEVVCVTVDGAEKFSGGTGTFTILTDGPFADIYRDGQLVHSISMPTNDEIIQCVDTNGLQVTGFSVSIPENRNNYFVKRNLNGQNQNYRLPGVTAWNNIDLIADSNDNAKVALNDGNFLTSFSLQNGKIYAWTVFEEKSDPEWKEITEALPGEKNHYRLETTAGMVRLYGNGKWMASFRSVISTGAPQLGINITSGSLDYLAVSDYTDLYLYQDSFDETGLFESQDYWRQTNFEAMVEDGTLVLDASKKDLAIAELNAYASNAEVLADVTLTECKNGFWFIVNHSIEEEYTKVGYNALSGKFEIVDVVGTENVSTSRLRKVVEGEFPLNQKVSLLLKMWDTENGKEIVLYQDGKEVLHHAETDYMIPMTQRGKVGFLLSYATAKIHNFSYRGDAKPILSVNDTNPIHNQTNTLCAIENEDGLVLVNNNSYWYSQDGGKSWAQKNADPLQSCDVYELANGEYISIKIKEGTPTAEGLRTMYFVAAISSDGGRTYTEVGTVSGPGINETEGGTRLAVTSTGARVYQGESGRIYFVAAEGGSENNGMLRVYYSDDNGRNWTPSQTMVDSGIVGATVHEAKCIELKDGHCRLFSRTEIGSVIYFDSYDYGKTWDLNYHMLPMLSAANCFNVDQDRNQRNILYMGWPYDNANLGGLIQYPRTRWAIAVSYDWGENWEYIGTTAEYLRNEASFYNMVFNITEDYLIQNACSITESTGDYLESSIKFGGRFIVIERDKQISTNRFERLHLRFPNQLERQSVISPEQKRKTLVVNPGNGKILVGNELVDLGTFGDGVLVEHLAALVGAKVENTADGGIVFHHGDSKVTFRSDFTSQYQGKKYLDLQTFVSNYDLHLVETGSVYVISEFTDWNIRALRAFRLATNPLSDEM